MTEQKSGAQISTKAFIQAVAIIFLLMMVAGILTLVIPAGQYTRIQVDGREVIDPAPSSSSPVLISPSGAGSPPRLKSWPPPMG